jgi:hypothetical protein
MPNPPTKAWAVKHWRGSIYPLTVQSLRKDSVDSFIEAYGKPEGYSLLDKIAPSKF